MKITAEVLKTDFDKFYNSRAFEKIGFNQGIGTGKSCRKHEKYLIDHLKKWKKYGRGDAHFVYKYPERKWSIIKHLLINYPFVKSYKAIGDGGIKYAPFFILAGIVRFVNFLEEYILLKFKYKEGIE